MKLPGRVMAGAVMSAGGFRLFFLFFLRRRVRAPSGPATHPRLFRQKLWPFWQKWSFCQTHNVSNDHNSAVRRATELILGMPYTSRPARNSWDRSRGRSSSVDRRKWRILEKFNICHEIGLHKPDFDETWYDHNYVTRRITACYSRYNDFFWK